MIQYEQMNSIDFMNYSILLSNETSYLYVAYNLKNPILNNKFFAENGSLEVFVTKP